MDRAAAITTLRRFNQGAAELEGSTFREFLASNDLSWALTKTGEQWAVDTQHPTEESEKAFLLDLRFFYQDRDGISLRKIAELYDDPTLPISDDLHAPVRVARQQVNRYLDSTSPLISGDTVLTRRDVFETWLYGHQAHLDPRKVERFEQWAASRRGASARCLG